MDYKSLLISSKRNKLSEKEFFTHLKNLQELYENAIPELEDEEFDLLVDEYEKRFEKKFELVGFIPRDENVNLPYKMPSIDKIKGDDAKEKMEKWGKKHTPEFVVMDKLDGVSLQYVSSLTKDELYTRGNGTRGSDKSYFLKHLNLPQFDEEIVIRGELVFEKEKFDKYVESHQDSENKMKKSRNLVIGCVNQKQHELDVELLSCLTFYAYTIMNDNLSKIDQLKKLKKLGFKTPWAFVTDEIEYDDLEHCLLLRKGKYENTYKDKDIVEAKYDIDGLVICDNENEEVAFKIDTLYSAIVRDIIWNLTSKDGKIIPTLIIDPINMLGSTVEHFHCHNARLVIDNGIGIGSEILVALGGDIIPAIKEVIKKSNNMVYPDVDYEWGKNNVHFIIKNKDTNDDVKRAQILYFMKHMSIKDVSEATILLLYENGFDSLEKLFNMKANDIDMLNNLGKKSALTICGNIKDAITNTTLNKIMAASTIFGEGLAENRLRDLLRQLNIETVKDLEDLNKNIDLRNRILSVNGFGDILTDQFIDKLPNFLDWINGPIGSHITFYKKKLVNNSLTGKSVVFSGFRDSKLTEKAEEMGIYIKTSVSRKTDLVVSDTDENTGKLQKAKEYKIPIVTYNDFVKMLK